MHGFIESDVYASRLVGSLFVRASAHSNVAPSVVSAIQGAVDGASSAREVCDSVWEVQIASRDCATALRSARRAKRKAYGWYDCAHNRLSEFMDLHGPWWEEWLTSSASERARVLADAGHSLAAIAFALARDIGYPALSVIYALCAQSRERDADGWFKLLSALTNVQGAGFSEAEVYRQSRRVHYVTLPSELHSALRKRADERLPLASHYARERSTTGWGF